MNTYSLYWIHLDNHTDYNTQGYIGVSKHVEKRFKEHRYQSNCRVTFVAEKYGWKNLKTTVLAKDLDKEAVLLLEEMLRPSEFMGWNLAIGGSITGGTTGPLSEKHKAKISKSNLGKIRTEEHKENYKLSKQGDKNPMTDKFGTSCCNFKYILEATNIKTGDVTLLYGGKHMRELGFDDKKVYTCANGKRKSHKGHTFKRIVYGK
jgi:hypothetical protein